MSDQNAQLVSTTASAKQLKAPELPPLGKSWSDFIDQFFEAWTFVFIVATVGLLIYSTQVEGKTIQALLAFLISLSSGAVGVRGAAFLYRQNKGEILRAKGEPSLRALNLLLKDTVAFSRRVAYFKSTIEPTPENKCFIQFLDEVTAQCNRTGEHAISSIGNWKDTIPEADVDTQIGIFTDLRDELGAAKRERQKLAADLAAAEGKGSESERKLKAELEKKDQEISRLNREMIASSPPWASGTPFTDLASLSTFKVGQPFKAFVGTGGKIIDPDVLTTKMEKFLEDKPEIDAGDK